MSDSRSLPNLRKKKLLDSFKYCKRFVKPEYGQLPDTVGLNWLLSREKADFSVLKMAFNELNKNSMSDNLRTLEASDSSTNKRKQKYLKTDLSRKSEYSLERHTEGNAKSN